MIAHDSIPEHDLIRAISFSKLSKHSPIELAQEIEQMNQLEMTKVFEKQQNKLIRKH